MLHTNHNSCSIPRSSPIATLAPAGKCEEIQEVGWNQVQCNMAKLLPETLEDTRLYWNLLLNLLWGLFQMQISQKRIVCSYKNFLNSKDISIVSQTKTDITRTNLIEPDIPTEDPPTASKSYTCTLVTSWVHGPPNQAVGGSRQNIKEHKQWANPILVVPYKEEHEDINGNNISGSSKNSKFNLELCIHYRKFNSQIQTACQIKADGSLGKVISNYSLPTIDSMFQ